MKRLEDYTKEELLALSGDEVDNLIDLECAHAGVQLLPPKPESPKVEKEPSEDMAYYVLSELNFIKMEDAMAVAAVVAEKERTKTKYVGGRYDYVLTGTIKEIPEIASKKLWSEAHYNQIAHIKERIEFDKKAYEKQKNEYDRIVESRQEISSSVLAAVEKARDEKYLLEMLCRDARRYLKLALGDKEIAKRFMLDARKNYTEHIENHFEGWVIENVRNAITEAM
jgi:hypothetical protein